MAKKVTGINGLDVRSVGNKCPKCGHSQFSIVPFGIGERPDFLDKSILGLADCRGCNANFWVCLAPELENSLKAIAEEHNIKTVDDLMNFLFRG